ncbi:MAG: amidohydrolase [Gammaproteobacteria bacterium]|nr:amidohydrolase [Gammaproteobacteria bacterium]
MEVEPKADIVLLLNARIHTVSAEGSVLKDGAMAVASDGTLAGIGDRKALLAAFPASEQVDLGGHTVVPGLIDSHAHLAGLAQSFTRANLVGAQSKDEVLRRLRDFEAGLPAGAWLLGRGWDQNDWPDPVFPSRRDLDAAFPDRPVWLRRIDGHAGWANSRALAEVDRDLTGDWQDRGGFIHRDSTAEPTGILVDKAMDLVERAVPPDSPELLSKALDMATQALVRRGLTGVHEAGTSLDLMALYRSKIEDGAMPVRIYAMADGLNEAHARLCEEGRFRDPSGMLQMRAVKLYADGALGSRGAALLEDYSDEPGNQGLMFMTPEELDRQLRDVLSCGLQVGVHAIGDRANREVLDALERIAPDYPDNPGRHRLEHAQILSPADIPRFAALGVIAAMQPIHATSDMYWADERLGEERLEGAYAWQSLADHGAHLALGSDFPVEAVNPFLGLYAAVTRQDLEGWPEGGWQPQQRLTREQALRGYTLDAAYAAFMEQEVGSLEPGKQADFIVIDRDIMTVPPEEIPGTVVLETWVGGKRVFQR